MSINALKWAIDQKTGSPLKQLILITLADMTNVEKGYSWASHAYLANRCQCSRKTVTRNLKYLEADGYIRIQNRTEGNIKTSNHYYLNVSESPNGTIPDGTESPKGRVRESQGGRVRESHKPLTSLTLNEPLSKSTVQNEFARWWAVYPLKKGRKPALAIWMRIKPDADTLIADTVNKAANDDNWLRGYIPNPTTYLNQERWYDELTPPKPEQLTQDEQYGQRKQRAAAILQELNGSYVGDDGPALPSPMDQDEW
jgi:hypothetical protein